MKQTAAPNTAHSVDTADEIVVERCAQVTLAEPGGGKGDEADRRRQGRPFETPVAEIYHDRQGSPRTVDVPGTDTTRRGHGVAEGRYADPRGDRSIGEVEQFAPLTSRPQCRQSL